MDIIQGLNERQLEAALQVKGPLLILAGAGSGKTRVIIHRIAYMIEKKNISPNNIMAITFTNKAAKEMKERVEKLLGDRANGIWVSTFHSTCARILRTHIDKLGYSKNYTIYDSDDQKNIVKEALKRLDMDPKDYRERAIMGVISRAKDDMIDPKAFTDSVVGDYRSEKIAKVYEEYQKMLKANNALDFDDLLCKCVELFQNYPKILREYQERFKYIMVDEYQDTNKVQFELVRLLAKKHGNLCVVGDDDQSIYKFRGANIGNILDFEKVFDKAKVVRLEQNYRSTKIIIEAANGVIANNIGRKDKSLWTDNDKGKKICYRQFNTVYDEADYIADDIAKRKRNKEIKYKDCAILYRTNAQSRVLEEKLIREGIPYDIVGGVNFYARKEIKDMLAYLYTVDNANDSLMVKRIINVPRRGIGNTTIEKLDDYAIENDISFYQAICNVKNISNIGKSVAKIDEFKDIIEGLRLTLAQRGISELIYDIVERSGYVRGLATSDDELATDRINNINELINKIVQYEKDNPEATLSDFLGEVSLIADIDNIDSGDEKVLLMTLHSAKGLEFQRVYLAGMEDGLFPSEMCIDEGEEAIEEERRLAYVGITRARQDLTITCAKERMYAGQMKYYSVSRFVEEIPTELLDNRPARLRRFSSFGEDDYRKRSGKLSSGNYLTEMYGISKVSSVNADEKKPIVLKKGAPIVTEVNYGVGDRVKHIKYGEGIIIDMMKEDSDYKVTVEFDMVGIKIMKAGFAKLKKL